MVRIPFTDKEIFRRDQTTQAIVNPGDTQETIKFVGKRLVQTGGVLFLLSGLLSKLFNRNR